MQHVYKHKLAFNISLNYFFRVINYFKKIIKINKFFKKILLCRKWKFLI